MTYCYYPLGGLNLSKNPCVSYVIIDLFILQPHPYSKSLSQTTTVGAHREPIIQKIDCASWLSRWARCMSYHLSCEKHRMAGLDDCSILQLRHLVRNRLGGTHDSISVQNLRAHSFTCRNSQAMCHTTKEHLACRDLRKIRVFRGTRYPTTLEDQSLRMSSQVST
jgi:hypothetical protein